MHILPTRGRPRLLQRFLDMSRPKLPGVVIIDLDQVEMYKDLRLPSNWTRMEMSRTNSVKKENAAYRRYPASGFYCVLNDDLIARTDDWEAPLLAEAQQFLIPWPDDTITADTSISSAFIPGAFCRALGWVSPPMFRHYYIDRVWHHIANELGIARYHPEIVVEHMHFSVKKSDYDTTYAERPPVHEDANVWEEIKKDGTLADFVETCRLVRCGL